ncbi:MAG: chemotaxis protein CheD [Planctomycetes bacterium]|nr:chemotaxis protein CheD [Planctomycetota bacterium]
MILTKMVVGMSDAKFSDDINDVLVTYSLGSCVAVCMYEPAAQIGGLFHYQLPDSKLNPEKAERNPFMFADTGLKIMIDEMISMGAQKGLIHTKIVGGATIRTAPSSCDIGKRNYLAIRKLLWRHGMFIDIEDIGGNSPRSLYMNMESGTITIRSVGFEKRI